MAIFFEVISVIGTVIWEMIKCFFTIVLENLHLDCYFYKRFSQQYERN